MEGMLAVAVSVRAATCGMGSRFTEPICFQLALHSACSLKALLEAVFQRLAAMSHVAPVRAKAGRPTTFLRASMPMSSLCRAT